MTGRFRSATAVLVVVGALMAAACSPGDSDGRKDTSAEKTINLVTHESWSVSGDVLKEFERSSGYTVKQSAPGDGGTLVNELILTKDAPTADVVYGIDNAFASRAVKGGILQPYTSINAGAEQDELSADDAKELTAIDFSDVCVNVDHRFFAEKNLAEPATFQDLTRPEYRDMLVVENPTTSTPGLAWMLGTISYFGEDGWLSYWEKLKANGLKVVANWSDAYSVDFSGSSGKGKRPLAISYASSPPVEVTNPAASAPTGALLSTCSRQIEYAGLLKGAPNPEGGKALIDFLLSERFQQNLPEQMYVYPAKKGTKLPKDWATFAPLATKTWQVDPEKIESDRERWLEEWSERVVG